MLRNQPDKAQLTIASEERLSPDMLGIDLRVKILDQANQPVNGQLFKVHVDGDVLVQGATDEQGEYSGQRVLTVQEGTQRKVFLVLEDSAVTDWKVIGEKQHKEEHTPEVVEATTYVFAARMKDFTTTIKLPAHNHKFDEDRFMKLLAGDITLTKDEKKHVIESIPKLRLIQIDAWIDILEENRRKYIELSPKHSAQIKKLEDEHYADWRELEMEYEATRRQQAPAESAYVFGARMQGFTTTIKLPSHDLQIDENTLLRLLAGSISFTLRDKYKIIDTFWKLTQSQADEFIQDLSKDFTRFQDISASSTEHHQSLKELEDKAAADWLVLERIFSS